MIHWRGSQFVILSTCLTIVLLTPSQPPALGACGTAYYFVVYMLSSTLAQALSCRQCSWTGRLGLSDFLRLNFAIAGAPALAFYRRRAWFGQGYPVVMVAGLAFTS